MRERLRFSRAALTAVLTGLLVALGATYASAQPPGRVNGVVRDTDEQPVKGATVTAHNENIGASYTASTDDKGRFTLLGLRPGDWTFVAGAPGFASGGGRMSVRAAANLNPPLLFTLVRNGPGAGGALERVAAKDLQAQLSAADTLFSQKKYDESIAAYRAILASAPPLAFLHLQIASAYLEKSDLPRAQAAYEELLKSNPGSGKALVGVAEIKLKQGDSKGAEDTLLRAAQAADVSRDVLLSLGELTAADGRQSEAEEWFRKASGVDPYWGKPIYRLAQLATAKGDATASATYMERVIAVDPASPEATLAKAALSK